MSRQPARKLCKIARAACAVVVLGAGANFGQADEAKMPMSGAQIAEQVNAALVASGQAGNALIAAERRYYPCESPLRVTPRLEGRWDAVDVYCDAPLHWNIVVRTTANGADPAAEGESPQAPIRSAVVLKHSIRKGEVLTGARLEVRDFDKALAPGIYADPQELIGRRMAQGLGAGVPIRERHLQPAWAVVGGTPVVIEMAVGGLTVSASGEALEDGQIGDSVSVKNLRSGKVVRGFVTGEKKVSLGANMN